MALKTYEVDIIAKLKTIAQGITEIKQIITDDFDEKTAYPCLTISSLGMADEFLSLGANKRTYRFMLRVIGNIEGTRTTQEDQIRNIKDTLCDELAKQVNITLTNTISWSQFTVSAPKLVSNEASYFVYEIEYKAVVLFNRG